LNLKYGVKFTGTSAEYCPFTIAAVVTPKSGVTGFPKATFFPVASITSTCKISKEPFVGLDIFMYLPFTPCVTESIVVVGPPGYVVVRIADWSESEGGAQSIGNFLGTPLLEKIYL
jgi:hypothetical protein